MDLESGTGFVCAPTCGDVLKLYITVDDEGFVDNLQCKVFGCEATSYVEERFSFLEGMSVDEIAMMDIEELTDEADEDGHVSVLMLNGIHSAVMDYAEKKYRAENPDCKDKDDCRTSKN